ncbi:LysR family transcriptional regulator [Candidatus Galacturonibacter soehngenii]|nr:LysR family transcriptional regulator [Candidatus Galacturonibacter soehngenii]
MDLHYLEIFNTVAKYESYKKASEILHISQPALSVQIKRLEAQIGLKLFDKIGNKIYLSENGMLLREYTNKIFNIVEELEEAILDAQTYIGGTLNIGGSNTPGSYILPELIGEFQKLYPSTKFNLHIGNTSEISQLINNGTLDIAINGGNCSYHEQIFVEKLYSDYLVIVASPQNPYCEMNQLTSKELKDLRFVVHNTDSQLYTYYNSLVENLNIPENINMYLGNVDAIKKAVSVNLGVSLLPYVAVKHELQFGVLKKLDFTVSNIDYPYSLIYNKNKALSATVKSFIEFVRKNISNYTCESEHVIREET